MSRRHHVELTEVVSTDVGTDHITEGVVLTPDMDERDLAGGELAVDHFFASGAADDLRSLRDEPRVGSVLIKEEVHARIRRAREGQ